MLKSQRTKSTIHRTRAAHRWALLALLVAAVSVQCAKNPVTGKREINLMSESQEVALGAQSDPGIVAQYGLLDDPALQAYVEQIGNRMAAVSHRPNLKFHFRVLDDPIVNAFALPGGYVYLTRGILAYLTDEAAMAGVLGHEIGHVTARHGAQRYTQQQLFGLGLGLGAVFSPTFAQYANVAGAAAQLLLLKYGRDDERQSDELGVEYATKIGYDTAEMANFFHSLDRLTAEARSGLPSWASTHPDPGERHEKVLALTRDWQGRAARSGFSTNREAYLRKIEGMVFGNNPRHGFVEQNHFLHPDLAFKFPIPPNWQAVNSATQVQLIAPQGKSAVIFSLEDGVANPRAAASRFVNETRARVLEQSDRPIGDYEGFRVHSAIQQQDGRTLEVVSTWVQKDGRVFVFHGLGADLGASLQVSNGFRRLTDPAALAAQPAVVKIVPAQSSGPFRRVAFDYKIPKHANVDLEGLAVLNGVGLNDPIEAGQLIKVLEER